MSSNALTAIPTHVISGFLGSGKTTLLLHLLRNKPPTERWAVLVNEFGEIGIDGDLIQTQHDEQQQVFIKEVPGGCMCCTAGLPMQMALSMLLARARPDRLLIEPTGLGHPNEVLETLSAPHNRKTLSLQKTVTLIDARVLGDSRYTEHEIFQQQIDVADLIIGSKADLYLDQDAIALKTWAGEKPIQLSRNGDVALIDLCGPTAWTPPKKHEHDHAHDDPDLENDINQPVLGERDVVKAANQGDGFHSLGFRFGGEHQFSYAALLGLLSGLDVLRCKGVFNTDRGPMAFNFSESTLTQQSLDMALEESRIEIIGIDLPPQFESDLNDCLTT